MNGNINLSTMKTLSASLLFSCVIALSPTAALANSYGNTETVDGYEYTYSIIDGGAEIGVRDSDGNQVTWQNAINRSPSGVLQLPSTLGGYPVTAIGSYAFYYCSSMTGVIIPATVTSMGDYAFGNCSSLSSVFFNGNAPTEVGCDLYSLAPSDLITQVRFGSTGWESESSSNLPETWPTSGWCPRDIRTWETAPYVSWIVTFDIGDAAERIGGGLLEQTIYDGGSAWAPTLSMYDDYTFDSWSEEFSSISRNLKVKANYRQDGKLIDGYGYTENANGHTWTFSIIDGEAEIGARDDNGNRQWQCAVGNCYGSITVPDTLGGCPVTRIGYCAFVYGDVSTVTLPESLKEIHGYAFHGCYDLTRCNIPAAVTAIGDDAFHACWQLRYLDVDGDNPYYSSEDGVLYDKDKSDLIFWPQDKKIALPSTLRNIRERACYCNSASSGETLVVPSTVTNIGNSAFYCCSLGGIELNEGLRSIGFCAFYNNYSVKYVVIPSTVERVDSDVFDNCSSLRSVYFKGNAPAYVSSAFYNDAPSSLITYVKPGSTGWQTEGSSDLPEKWPLNYSREIQTWTTYPNVSWRVQFDVDDMATCVGGGSLDQMVCDGCAAEEPLLSVVPGYSFAGWDSDFDCITAPKTVRAVFIEDGITLADDLSTCVEPAWSSSVKIEYDGLAGTAQNFMARLYYLRDGRWVRILPQSISGDFTLSNGHHVITVDLSDVDIEPGEMVFKIEAVEKLEGFTIINDDGWIQEGETLWRSREVDKGETTTLSATVTGEGSFSFEMKTQSDDDDDGMCLVVDGERWYSLRGNEGWYDDWVTSWDGETRRISWTYVKGSDDSTGRECGWVDIEGMLGKVIGSVLVTAEFEEPAFELHAECRDDGTVALVPDAGYGSATIYYTLDGSAPNERSSIYEGPFDWSTFKLMRAVAVYDEFEWSQMFDGRDCVRIFLDPTLGAVEVPAVIRHRGEPYGELPEASRDWIEFNGWSDCEWDLTGERYWAIDESQEVYGSRTLYATWNISPDDIMDPDVSFDQIDIGGEYSVGRLYSPNGYYDEDDDWIFMGSDCIEYVDIDVRSEDGDSTNVLLSLDFEGAGAIDFTYLDYIGYDTAFVLDGVRCTREGDRIKVLTQGEHHLEITEQGSSSTIHVGAIVWTPADEDILVTFDAMSGTASQSKVLYEIGSIYAALPTATHPDGYEFLGWFTDPETGSKVEVTDWVDFDATTLYAHWQTTLKEALNVTGGNLNFTTSGTTGWKGVSGLARDGVTVACSDWVERGEANVLATSAYGKGLLSFWWRTEDAHRDIPTIATLTVDGKAIELHGDDCEYLKVEKSQWRHFTYPIASSGAHKISWSMSIELDDYDALSSALEYLSVYDPVQAPRMLVDGVSWISDAVQTDVVDWGHSSIQALQKLPDPTSPMVQAYADRIASDPTDYDARIRRAITRLKELSENEDLRALVERSGYKIADDWTSISGIFDLAGMPESNEAVDELARLLIPALDLMLNDLDVIPGDWSGTVALSSDEYPVDEDIYLDMADIYMLRSMLHGAKASLLLSRGYDLTVDKDNLASEIDICTNRQSLTIRKFNGSWNNHQCSRLSISNRVGYMRVAADGLKLKLDYELPQDILDKMMSEDDVCDYLYFSIDRDVCKTYADKGMTIPQWFEVSWNYNCPNDFSANISCYCCVSQGNDDARYYDWEWYHSDVSVTANRSGNHLQLTLEPLSFQNYDEEEIAIYSLCGLRLNSSDLHWWEDDVLSGDDENKVHIYADSTEYKHELTYEAFLAAHPQFMSRVRSCDDLAASKREFKQALELYGKFDQTFRGRTDTVMHFFEYDSEYEDEMQLAADQVKLAIKALDEVVTVNGSDFTICRNFKYADESVRMTLKPLFDGKILRSLVPEFVDDLPVLCNIPDITFGGTFPDWTMESQKKWLKQINGIWDDRSRPVEPDPEPDPEPEESRQLYGHDKVGASVVDTSVANVFDGYLYSGDAVAGTIQVKLAKAKSGKCKLSATILVAGGKKTTATGNLDVTTGEYAGVAKNGTPLALVVGANGIYGTFGAYEIDGARNRYSSKAAGDVSTVASADKWIGTYGLASGDSCGWDALSVTVAKKGKAKVSGTLADGTKVSSTTKLIIGEDCCCIPIAWAKKGVVFTACVWLGDDGLSVTGLDDALLGVAGNLSGASSFLLDVEALESLWSGTTVPLMDFVPDGAEVVPSGKKWIVMPDASGKAMKAGKVVWDKGNNTVNAAKSKIDGYNVSGLKLSYTAKTGLFKGSFKVYTLTGGSLKTVSASTTGVVIDGKAYGTATIKKVGGVSVEIK